MVYLPRGLPLDIKCRLQSVRVLKNSLKVLRKRSLIAPERCEGPKPRPLVSILLISSRPIPAIFIPNPYRPYRA